MPNGGAKVIDDVLSGKKLRLPDIVPPGRDVRVGVEIFFQRVDGAAVKEVEPEEPQELAAGAQYIVIVTLRQSGGAEAVEIGDGMAISLKWLGSDFGLPIVGQADPVQTALLAKPMPLRSEFTLTIPEQTPVTKGELLVKASGVEREPRVLRRRAVAIVGRIHAPPKEFSETVLVRLQPVPDPKLAVLHIAAKGDGIHITGYHPLVPTLMQASVKLPKSLADVAGQEPSRKVHEAVQEYSLVAIPELLGWMDKVIDATAGDVAITIAEHVDSQVPWEMLVLEDGTAPLGARVPVVRWTKVTRNKDLDVLDPMQQVDYGGSVLTFVDAARLKQSKLEVDELAQCKGVQCKDVDDLLDHLDEPPEDMALLFLSCHGTFAQNAEHEAELAAAHAAGSGITTLKLADVTTPPSRPAVIVNACHSARISRTALGLTGLPNFFLAKYARSYFGTLGAVDETFAAALGRDLIRAARAPDGVNLAVFLFEVRKRAWDDFRVKKKSQRDYWTFVSAFMYVLYGSMHNRMQLLPSKADG